MAVTEAVADARDGRPAAKPLAETLAETLPLPPLPVPAALVGDRNAARFSTLSEANSSRVSVRACAARARYVPKRGGGGAGPVGPLPQPQPLPLPA